QDLCGRSRSSPGTGFSLMKRSLGLLCLTTLLSVPAAPQGTPQFTFKTSTEVVLVNVTVRDKDGNFVRDLKADDFSVLEDGKNQKVISLDVENTDALVGNSDIQVPNLLGTLNTKPSNT